MKTISFHTLIKSILFEILMLLPVSAIAAIPQVAAGGFHSIGLKEDSTVIATGDNVYGQCDVNTWNDIEQVAEGWFHTLGLKPDVTVVAVGWNASEQCNVSSWSNISQVAAGFYHSVGLKNNGTVVAVGSNTGQTTDWWAVAQKAWYHYRFPPSIWQPGVNVTVQTGLFDLPTTQILNGALPLGNYPFYFAVDDNVDGIPDATWVDSINVTVEVPQ